jgi:hypothetical protein
MQTSYTYTPEIQFVRKCWQPVFAEVPRPIRPINGYFGACAPSSYMLRWRKAGDCARTCITSDGGRTVTLESPLNKLWMEDKQCAFALWFLQLL